MNQAKFFCLAALRLLSQSEALADSKLPEETLKRFYDLVGQHQCEDAVKLAIGYTLERCRNVETVRLGGRIQRKEESYDRVVLEFSVSYRKKRGHQLSVTAIAPVLWRDDAWQIDMAAVRQAIQKDANAVSPSPPSTVPKSLIPNTSQDGNLQPTPTLPLDSRSPGRPFDVLRPGFDHPNSPADQQAIKPFPPGLLGLWSPEQLRGKPGDERITLLRAATHTAPYPREPSEALPRLPPKFLHSIRAVKPPPGKKWVALTFDLCEQADEVSGYDRSIINTLREKNAKATFFAGGKWMQTHPEKAMQLMADPLFEIGNHTWTHGNLRVLTGQALRDQIVWTQAEYQNLWNSLRQRAAAHGLELEMTRIPRQPRIFRFPYGTCSAEALQLVNATGLGAIQWDVVTGDPGHIAPTRSIIQAIRPGSIVIFHANGRGRGTAAALPEIIDALKAKGFEFLTVSRMLAGGVPKSVNECYELKPGDNRHYDAEYGGGTERPKKRSIPATLHPAGSTSPPGQQETR